MKPHLPQDPLSRVEAVLSRVKHRMLHHDDSVDLSGEPVTWRTPLDELIEREEAAIEAADERSAALLAVLAGELPERLREQMRDFVKEEFASMERAWLGWVFADGPHLLDVLRRIYLYAKHKRADLLWNMNFRDLGDLFDKSHAAMHTQSKVLFGAVPAGWKKPAGACRRMSEAQRGNANRRGGKKVQTALHVAATTKPKKSKSKH